MRIILFLLTFLIGYYTDMGMCWIAAAVGAGLGVLSSLYGGSQASKAARKAKGELEKASQDEKAWYEKSYNQDYSSTSAGQRLISKAREISQLNSKRAEGAARVAGATSSSEAKMKEQGNKVVSDTISQIAATDSARKDSLDKTHRASQDSFSQQRMNIENNRAAQITNAASQASNALISAGAYLDGNLKTKGTAPKEQKVSNVAEKTTLNPDSQKNIADDPTKDMFYPPSPTRSFFDFMNKKDYEVRY